MASAYTRRSTLGLLGNYDVPGQSPALADLPAGCLLTQANAGNVRLCLRSGQFRQRASDRSSSEGLRSTISRCGSRRHCLVDLRRHQPARLPTDCECPYGCEPAANAAAGRVSRLCRFLPACATSSCDTPGRLHRRFGGPDSRRPGCSFSVADHLRHWTGSSQLPWLPLTMQPPR